MVSPNSTQNAILNRGFSLNIILPLNGFSHKSTCVNQTQLIKQIGSLLVRNCAEMELIKHLDWFRVLLVLTLGWANCPKTYGIAALQNQAKESKRQRRQRTFRHESKVDAALVELPGRGTERFLRRVVGPSPSERWRSQRRTEVINMLESFSQGKLFRELSDLRSSANRAPGENYQNSPLTPR